MSRMKTFFIYLLIFVGLYVISNLLISAFIKTSYYKISSYDIDVSDASITIIEAKASKDDGYIEGKIVNNTNEKITDKYMKVELFSDNNVSLGTEYVKIENFYSGDLKNFKITFTCDNVTYFKITFITEEEKNQIEAEEENQELFEFDENVENIVDSLNVGI